MSWSVQPTREGSLVPLELQDRVAEGVRKVQDFKVRVGNEIQSVAAQKARQLREAPRWAKNLVLTDWVTVICMVPIIAGLVVFLVFLPQAQSDFKSILDLMNASGGITSLIKAYSIFVAVTLPLVVLSLIYAVGLMLGQFLFKVRVQRNADLSSDDGAFKHQRVRIYKIMRGALIFQLIVQYLGLLWLIVSVAATVVLQVTSFAIVAVTNSAVDFSNTALYNWEQEMSKILEVHIPALRDLAYQNNITISGESINVGELLNFIAYSALNNSVAQEVAGIAVKTVCPDFCVNMAFLKEMLHLDHIQECICTPEVIAEIGQHASHAKGKLWAALAGLIVMICAWIALLMRLAATHDVLRVKYKLQNWLDAQGYVYSFRTAASEAPLLLSDSSKAMSGASPAPAAAAAAVDSPIGESAAEYPAAEPASGGASTRRIFGGWWNPLGWWRGSKKNSGDSASGTV